MRRETWLVAILVAMMGVLAGVACRRGVPVVDPGPNPPTRDGTISGRLSTSGDGARLSARRVEAINVATGDRRAVSTSADGGFTLKVSPGKYRLHVELRAGEAIVKGPDTIAIDPSDLDSDVAIEIAVAPTRPHPADSTRSVEGLGAPIA